MSSTNHGEDVTDGPPMKKQKSLDSISKVAGDYYDSDDAFRFYRQVWGGESIHVGLFDDVPAGEGADAEAKKERIVNACRLSAVRLFEKSGQTLTSESKVCDMGSAYGGTARHAAKTFGCEVLCVDISKKENEHNRQETEAAGLGNLVKIPKELSYFDTEAEAECMDLVISQDAFLHAGSERYRAISEAGRILKTDGFLVFTDIMQSDDAKVEELGAVYKRIHLDDMGSPSAYEEWGKKCGLELVEFEDRTSNLAEHYGVVCELLELMKAGDSLKDISDEYVTNMIAGLNAWVSAASNDNLRWGYMVFRKTGKGETVVENGKAPEVVENGKPAEKEDEEEKKEDVKDGEAKEEETKVEETKEAEAKEDQEAE